ncbi:MAG TPA: hypothetical protein VMY69_08470 [Phycisphaerae bacterium]|nr:hypothetical protein [Phycisphaerae bacterium]
MAFTDKELQAIAELMAAAREFLDNGVVDMISGTIPLVLRLKLAMDEIDRLRQESE